MTDIIMIHVEDDSGKAWNINLNYVEVVEFQSTQPGIQNNLNTDRIVMQGGEVINLPLGGWDLALTALRAEYAMGPVSPHNVTPKLYIGT